MIDQDELFSDEQHMDMGMHFVMDAWHRLCESGPDLLYQILKRVKLPPGSDQPTMERIKKMLSGSDSPRYFASQGGSAMCLFHATPFDQWPRFELPEAIVSGAPYPVTQDDAASTFATFFCWMMAKAEPQIRARGLARFPEPFRHWVYAYIGALLWVHGWVKKETFIAWAWERGLLASRLWSWDHWENLDLEKSGVLSLGSK